MKNKPLTFEECIIWARLQFEEKFSNEIKQLLHSLPKDAVTSSGQLFWSGPKRAPDPLTFDPNEVSRKIFVVFNIEQYVQPTHLQFIIAAANLHAFNYGLNGSTDPSIFKKVAGSLVVPKFVPKSGVKVQINDNDPVAAQDGMYYILDLNDEGS